MRARLWGDSIFRLSWVNYNFPCRFKQEWSVYGLVGPKNMLPTTTHQRCEDNFVIGKIFLMRQRHTTALTRVQVPPDDRHKLLLYLEAHNLSIGDFLSVIKGEKIPRLDLLPFQTNFMSPGQRSKLVICRIFIPFRKDEMKGTVVQLDRGSKSRGGRWLQNIIWKIQKIYFYSHHLWPKILSVKGLDWRNSGKEEMRERFLEWLRSRFELE